MDEPFLCDVYYNFPSAWAHASLDLAIANATLYAALARGIGGQAAQDFVRERTRIDAQELDVYLPSQIQPEELHSIVRAGFSLPLVIAAKQNPRRLTEDDVRSALSGTPAHRPKSTVDAWITGKYKPGPPISMQAQTASGSSPSVEVLLGALTYPARPMSGHDFERYATDALLPHVKAAYTTPGSGDYGIDMIIVDNDGIKWGVQLKFRNSKVSIGAVQAAYAGARFYGCDSAVVATTLGFTEQAKRFAEVIGVKLVTIGTGQTLSPSHIAKGPTVDSGYAWNWDFD